MSEVIEGLVEDLENMGVGCVAAEGGREGSTHITSVELVALHSLLRAREAVGVKTYGRTLDDYPPASEEFWLRMAAEELADALMYLQKASQSDSSPASNTATPRIAEALLVIMRDAYPDEIAQLAASAVNTKLFPPCKPEHA